MKKKGFLQTDQLRLNTWRGNFSKPPCSISLAHASNHFLARSGTLAFYSWRQRAKHQGPIPKSTSPCSPTAGRARLSGPHPRHPPCARSFRNLERGALTWRTLSVCVCMCVCVCFLSRQSTSSDSQKSQPLLIRKINLRAHHPDPVCCHLCRIPVPGWLGILLSLWLIVTLNRGSPCSQMLSSE